MSELRPRRLLEVFGRHGCRGIVIGGIAAAMYGLTYETDDLDLLCAREAADLATLAAALTELSEVIGEVPSGESPPAPAEPGWFADFLRDRPAAGPGEGDPT